MDELKKPSRRINARKLPPPNPWWLKQFQERPIAMTGSLASVGGGLILLWFFLVLGESPDMDIASIGAVPMAIALVGLAAAVATTACCFAAGIALRRDVRSIGGLSSRWTVGFLVLPGTLGVIALAIVATLFPDWTAPSIVYWLPFIGMLTAALFIAVLGDDASVVAAKRPGGGRVERFLDLIGLGSVWVLIAYSATFTFALLYQSGKFTSDMFVALFFWVEICYVLNLLVAWAPRNVFTLIGASIGLGLVSLVVLTSNARSFPSVVVSRLGLGEMPVSLVVTPKGCEQINRIVAGQPVCRVDPGEQSTKVCPVMLRSRIGTPFFIGFSAYAKDGKWPSSDQPRRLQAISIAKSEVLSWSRIDSPARTPSAPSSSALVTYMDSADRGEWLRDQCGAPPVVTASAPKP